jgi:hypothetical protein
MRIHRNSIIWLAVAALAFTLAVVLFTPLRMTLGWDETVYASQISKHVPLMPWGAERARGMPVLVAPVTLLTDSALALRVYLALLAGVGLFLALLAWRGLKPAWVLALSGLIFGGLAITQMLASQVFPNFWIALGGLAAVGLFLRGLTEGRRPRLVLVLLPLAVAFTALLRPADAVFISVPLMAAAVVQLVRRSMMRRSIELLGAVIVGLVVGGVEWAIEANMYFNGPFNRLHESAQVVGGTKFNLVNSLRIINGGRDSSVKSFPGVSGWSHPELLGWWFALLVLALLGVYVAARARGWLFAAVPVVCALSVYVLYSLPVRDNARYLLPIWALLAVPAAEGLGWLITQAKGRMRLAAVTVAAIFLAVEVTTQHAILDTQVRPLESAASANMNAANALKQLGFRAPCLITSVKRPNFAAVSEPAAFYSGCSYTWGLRRLPRHGHSRLAVLVQGTQPPWRYARQWPAHRLGDSEVFAYVQPAPPSSVSDPKLGPVRGAAGSPSIPAWGASSRPAASARLWAAGGATGRCAVESAAARAVRGTAASA